MTIVSNTSPLSNLAVIGELDLLQQIYPRILVPPVVRSELMQFSQIRPAIAIVLATGWLEVQTAQDLQLIWELEQTLDPGEAAAIALATELKADRLLIDERLGRRIAMQRGLKVRGILGIIVNAKNEGLLPAAKPLLDRLIHEAGFRMSQALYEHILQEAGEL